MLIVEKRVRGIDSPVDTERWVDRSFGLALDRVEKSIERVRVRVEPLARVFVCRARLWRKGAPPMVVRVKAGSPSEAVSHAAEALFRRLRRSGERRRSARNSR